MAVPTEPHADPAPFRPKLVKVYVSTDEYRELGERAGRYPGGSLSAYVRGAALHRPMEPVPPAPPVVNLAVWREASRGFGLLNQTVAQLHKGNIMAEARERAALGRLLTDLLAAVNAVRLLLVGRPE